MEKLQAIEKKLNKSDYELFELLDLLQYLTILKLDRKFIGVIDGLIERVKEEIFYLKVDL